MWSAIIFPPGITSWVTYRICKLQGLQSKQACVTLRIAWFHMALPMKARSPEASAAMGSTSKQPSPASNEVEVTLMPSRMTAAAPPNQDPHPTEESSKQRYALLAWLVWGLH